MKAMELDEKVEDFQVQLQSDAEDCQMLSISRTTLWRMCKNDLRTMRIGGLVRIRKWTWTVPQGSQRAAIRI